MLSDLFRDFTRERPLPRKHVVEWDVRLVLFFYQSDRFKDWGLPFRLGGRQAPQ